MGVVFEVSHHRQGRGQVCKQAPSRVTVEETTTEWSIPEICVQVAMRWRSKRDETREGGWLSEHITFQGFPLHFRATATHLIRGPGSKDSE